MATYLVLNKLTEQGIKSLKDAPHIEATVRADCERRGGKLLGMYWTQGRYDSALVVEMPNDIEFAAGLLSALSMGAITSETLRAFDLGEMTQIIEKMDAPSARELQGAGR